MAMLARRSIQKLLDASADYLTTEQVRKLADQLNNSQHSLGAEWELIALHAFSLIGSVEHEPALAGSAKLDVRFTSDTLKFVADIRAVSDETYHRENPVEALGEEFLRLGWSLQEEGIRGGFSFRVGGIEPSRKHREYKTRLVLPQQHEFATFIFNNDFDAYLERIRSEPQRVHHHVVNSDKVSLSIVFNPGSGGVTRSYPAFNSAHDAVHNVVYQNLERKAKQIKRAGKPTGYLAGVILCDGHCQMLRTFSSAWALSADRIIRSFLHDNNTVDFVCLVDVQYTHSSLFGRPLRFEARVWPPADEPSPCRDLEMKLNKALSLLPEPQRIPANAGLHWTTRKRRSRNVLAGSYNMASSMGGDSIQISLRATMDYIAGKIDRDEFLKIVNPDWPAYLRKELDACRSITVSTKLCENIDDDFLKITFGQRDPAVSPFVGRKASE